MPQEVCNGALIKCSFGAAPASLIVLPVGRVNAATQPAATIMDFVPVKNVPPFGMCSSPSNPAVAAATAAAGGVLTPQPCVPVIPAPWTPGATTVMVGGLPALASTSTCTCTWGGVVTINTAGQATVNVK